ncbi:MAG: acyl-CoA dehydrogenase family protein [Verrucomicrobia bacterium]|nr:acyl-CoA dehydrogenase family protein [Verrucomicrobiota bacterium]MBV9274230.1 acyl-CoA dehydrogenase family protein [Verrucomicrobiota bacterium]
MKPEQVVSSLSVPSQTGETKRQYPPIQRHFTGFSTDRLQSYLDGVHADIRNRIKSIITGPDFHYFEGDDYEKYRQQVLSWTTRLGKEIGHWFLPQSLGGAQDLPKFIAALETISFHDGSLLIKLGVQFGLFAGSVLRLGTAYHHRTYLPGAVSCELLGGFAMTEIGHGSNVQGLETTAVYDPENHEFIINSPTYSSGKTYIGNAARDGRMMAVFAQLEVGGIERGVHVFLVPIRDAEGRTLPGVTIQDNGYKMGLNGVDNGSLWFHQVRVPSTALLDRFAKVNINGGYETQIKSNNARFFATIGTLVGGRITLALAANSMAKAALTIAIRYAARRRQFGSGEGAPETLILDYPATQRRLMPRLAMVYGIHFAVRHLIGIQEKFQDLGGRPIESLAAALKAFATWNAIRTIQFCRESCGGEGYMAVNRFAALKADVEIFATFEGDNTVLLQLVAKNLLSELKDQLKQMDRRQVTRFLLRQTLNALGKRVTLSKLKKERTHLLNPEAQLAYFRFRETHLLLRAGESFRQLTRRHRMDAVGAFNLLQPDLLELAHAYAERQILERFIAGVQKAPDQSLSRPLGQLASLFALTQLEMHKGWYLENGFMSGRQSKAITELVSSLCEQVRHDAVALVDAFGIPDECLAAPIGLA